MCDCILLPQGNSVFHSKFLKLSHDAVCDARNTWRTQTQQSADMSSVQTAIQNLSVSETNNRQCSLTFSIEAVHHWLNYIKFSLYGEVDEICVHEDVIGRTELSVVLEEHTRWILWPAVIKTVCRHTQSSLFNQDMLPIQSGYKTFWRIV